MVYFFPNPRNNQIDMTICFNYIKENIKNNKDPIILCGDFNIIGGSQDYDDMMKRIETEFEFECKDILFECCKNHPITYGEMNEKGEKIDQVITTIEEFGNQRLDYILLLHTKDDRKQLQYKECNVQKFATKDVPFPFLSDHYGVEAIIELN